MKVSSAHAALILGVSRMQINRLIDAGEVDAERFGRMWQIDLDSLHRYADLRPHRGRPLAPAAAWRLLDHANPRSLDEARALAIRARRRAERRPSRVLPGELEQFLDDPRVVRSGSAVASRVAPVADRPPYDVYARRSQFAAIASEYAIADRASDGNVVVRIVDDAVWPFADEPDAPSVVALVDLIDERDDRSARELVAVL